MMSSFTYSATFVFFALTSVIFQPVVSSPICQRAVFDMSGIRGQVVFEQHSLSSNTTIKVNLTGLTGDFTWKIHRYPVVYRGNAMYTCQSLYIVEMFDPYKKTADGNYSTQCDASKAKTSQSCAIGDLSGKHGYIRTKMADYLDPMLPLSGPESIFSRSLVLYMKGNSTPFACALVDSCNDVITAGATFRGNNSGITGTVQLRQRASYPEKDTSLDINLFYSRDIIASYEEFSLILSDTKLPEEGIPSYSSNDCPKTVANASITVKIPLASNGPSSKRMLLNLQGYSLSGSSSVIGKTLVLSRNDVPVICASIYKYLPLEGEAVFDVDGVKGTIHLKQDSELSPTVVTVNVRGLRQLANTYHVHVYRVHDKAVREKTNKGGICAGNFIAGHWNPYKISTTKNYPSPAQGTVDQYEVGDLSGKYGNIGSKDVLSLVFTDYNLPLFGQKSVLFRSMVFHYNNGSRWICSNIKPKDPTFHLKAKSSFAGTDYNGMITVEQASFIESYSFSHISTFFLDISYGDKSHPITSHHNWHVHQDRVLADQMVKTERCKSPMAHYNPYNVDIQSNYKATCSPLNLLRCELGDSSNKLGQYSIGAGKNRYTESENYFAGLYSILRRSFVVHAKDSGGSRITCATLEPDSKYFVEKELTFKTSKTATSEYDFYYTVETSDLTKSLADALQVNRWRVAHVDITSGEKCQKATFILISNERSDLDTAYENLKKNWPEKLKNYTPSCSLATNLQAVGLTLILLLTSAVYFM